MAVTFKAVAKKTNPTTNRTGQIFCSGINCGFNQPCGNWQMITERAKF